MADKIAEQAKLFKRLIELNLLYFDWILVTKQQDGLWLSILKAEDEDMNEKYFIQVEIDSESSTFEFKKIPGEEYEVLIDAMHAVYNIATEKGD